MARLRAVSLHSYSRRECAGWLRVQRMSGAASLGLGPKREDATTVITLRRAIADDALALSRLAEATFRAAFSAASTEAEMDRHCATRFGERHQGEEIAARSLETWLAMDGEAIAGFAQLRIHVRPMCVEAASACEVQRLYVDARFHGKGVAALLMDACIDSARGHGTAALWLGVWERNRRAIAFYAKCGFVEVGEQVFPLGRDLHRDLVMARPI